MTNTQKLINQIETITFEVKFSVISSFKIMLRALASDETIQQLIAAIQDNLSQAELIVERITTLADDKPDDGVMHPHDIKVLVYLYALNAADYPRITLSSIEKVQATKGFFWSAKYAAYIRAGVKLQQTRSLSYVISPFAVSTSMSIKMISGGINQFVDESAVDFRRVDSNKFSIVAIQDSDTDSIELTKSNQTNQISWQIVEMR